MAGGPLRPAIDTTFDAVMRRGVLNDLVLDLEREAAVAAFADLCHRGGLLLLDVREATASTPRADGRTRRTTASLPDGRNLVFTSRPVWEEGRIVVSERYELTTRDGHPQVQEYTFEMRPWTRDELSDRLAAHGFVHVRTLPGVGRTNDDRCSSRPSAADSARPKTPSCCGCHVQMHALLPSESASTQYDGAWASLTIVPPAASASAIRCSATSWGTHTSRWKRCRARRATRSPGTRAWAGRPPGRRAVVVVGGLPLVAQDRLPERPDPSSCSRVERQLATTRRADGSAAIRGRRPRR